MKVFISQPMTGLSEEQILNTREQSINHIRSIYGEDTEILVVFMATHIDII